MPWIRGVSFPYCMLGWGKLLGVIYARRHTKTHGGGWIYTKFHYPTDPATPAQLYMRERYGVAVGLWRALADNERSYWNTLPYPVAVSGWNRFVRWYMGGVVY